MVGSRRDEGGLDRRLPGLERCEPSFPGGGQVAYWLSAQRRIGLFEKGLPRIHTIAPGIPGRSDSGFAASLVKTLEACFRGIAKISGKIK